MAKASAPVPAEVATLLRAAEALDRGDNVTARTLAQQVLTQALPADESSKELKALAERYSLPGEPAAPSLHGLAADIVSRSSVPPKIYLLGLAAALSFIALAALAASRY